MLHVAKLSAEPSVWGRELHSANCVSPISRAIDDGGGKGPADRPLPATVLPLSRTSPCSPPFLLRVPCRPPKTQVEQARQATTSTNDVKVPDLQSGVTKHEENSPWKPALARHLGPLFVQPVIRTLLLYLCSSLSILSSISLGHISYLEPNRPPPFGSHVPVRSLRFRCCRPRVRRTLLRGRPLAF